MARFRATKSRWKPADGPLTGARDKRGFRLIEDVIATERFPTPAIDLTYSSATCTQALPSVRGPPLPSEVVGLAGPGKPRILRRISRSVKSKTWGVYPHREAKASSRVCGPNRYVSHVLTGAAFPIVRVSAVSGEVAQAFACPCALLTVVDRQRDRSCRFPSPTTSAPRAIRSLLCVLSKVSSGFPDAMISLQSVNVLLPGAA